MHAFCWSSCLVDTDALILGLFQVITFIITGEVTVTCTYFNSCVVNTAALKLGLFFPDNITTLYQLKNSYIYLNHEK